MSVPLYDGTATFDLAPALPRSGPDGPYTINLRARVTDLNGVDATSTPQALVIDTSTSTALADYVNATDTSYSFSLVSTVHGLNNSYSVYDLSMTSQTWRTTADVNHTLWQHRMQIVVPTVLTSTTALMLIDGGSIGDPPPGPDSSLIALALATGSVVAELKDIPNEPLTFTGDPNNPREEDDAIAYTYNEFMQNLGQPDNQTWPLLLPMVKAAVRGMDTVQGFVPTVSNNSQVQNFVITGYSKRGWTTWLTATVDSRVEAIIPGVFDALNLAEQMVHHYGAYGFFSPAIQPYNAEQIFDRILTPAGEALSAIVDPYRYLAEPQMAMPKLILNSTGDQFFVSDSAQYYIHDLPGTENYLRYIPNTGHGLDARTVDSTTTFYNAIVNNLALPQYAWTVEANGAIRAVATTHPSQVLMWQATNPTARDFRQGYTNVVWTSTVMFDEGGGVYTANLPTPASGATAYMIELTFPSPIFGNPYVFTTEIHVKTNLPLYAWPFASTIPVGAPGVVSNADLNGIASGLARRSRRRRRRASRPACRRCRWPRIRARKNRRRSRILQRRRLRPSIATPRRRPMPSSTRPRKSPPTWRLPPRWTTCSRHKVRAGRSWATSQLPRQDCESPGEVVLDIVRPAVQRLAFIVMALGGPQPCSRRRALYNFRLRWRSSQAPVRVDLPAVLTALPRARHVHSVLRNGKFFMFGSQHS